MEELTNKQEDDVLEQGRELDYERKMEIANETEDGSFSDWKGDYMDDLLRQFVEEVYPSEFENYCKDAYREHNERLI